MARIALNAPDIAARPPNTGDSSEYGDSFQTIINNINTMFTECFAGVKNAGGVNVRPAGNISAQVSTIGSSATNTTQTLMTYSLAANSLDAVGRGLYIEAWGRCAANAAPTTVNLNFGGQFISIPAAAHNASHWNLVGQVFKSAANAQQIVFYSAAGAVTAVKSATDSSTDASAITISVTCLDASAAQSNVLCDGMTVEWFQ